MFERMKEQIFRRVSYDESVVRSPDRIGKTAAEDRLL